MQRPKVKSNLSQQLPTSAGLRAAIGPELEALARQAMHGKSANTPRAEPSVDEVLQQPQTVQLLNPAVLVKSLSVGPESAAPATTPPAAVRARELPVAASARHANVRARTAPTVVTTPPKSHASTVVLGLMCAVAVASLGGAVWFAKKQKTSPIAVAHAEPAVTEDPVKFVVPVRPDNATASVVVQPAPQPVLQAATVVQPATPTIVQPPPAVVAAPVTQSAPPPVAAALPAPLVPDPTPPPTPAKRVVRTSSHADTPAPRDTKPEKTAAADDKKPSAPPPAAPPATTATAVDAILQQQLKSAMP